MGGAQCALQVGDVLVFGKLPDGTYVVMGRPGTKDDLVRKVPAKRTASDAPGPAAAATTREVAKKAAQQKPRQPVESLKSKRIKQKQAMQQASAHAGATCWQSGCWVVGRWLLDWTARGR